MQVSVSQQYRFFDETWLFWLSFHIAIVVLLFWSKITWSISIWNSWFEFVCIWMEYVNLYGLFSIRFEDLWILQNISQQNEIILFVRMCGMKSMWNIFE